MRILLREGERGVRQWLRRRSTARRVAHLLCYTRPDCCLCDQARSVLDRLQARGLVTVEYVSIEGDQALEIAYGARIPVVVLADEVLAEGKVSEKDLVRALAARSRDDRRG